MVDFLGTIVTAALMVVVTNALVVYLEIGRSVKLALATVAGCGSGWPPRQRHRAGSRSRPLFQ